MARTSKPKRVVFAVCCFVLVTTIFLKDEAHVKGKTVFASGQADGCIACHHKESDEAFALYKKSVHFAKGYSCNRCHGGDASAVEKAQAHAAGFTGRPTPSQILTMCGSCHRAQSAAFKTGKHNAARSGEPRVDCSECHGAHLAGAASRDFSFVYYCAGCHGQEYLPELPKDFQQMLALSDDIHDRTRKLEEEIGKLSSEAEERRKEIARRIGEIVHRTNLDGGRDKIPEILKLGEELKRTIQRK